MRLMFPKELSTCSRSAVISSARAMKDTTTLEQPERPLVGPIYRQKMPEVERLMLERIRERLGL